MKKFGVLLLWAIFLSGGNLFAQKEVFHFRFDKTVEQKSLADRTGKVRCYSRPGIFYVHDGGLRIAHGASFYIPHAQLPALKDEFTFNLWYHGSSRGLHNPLFSKGVHPGPLQFEIYMQNLSPAFFWVNKKAWEGIYTSGYNHLTAYPMKYIIKNKKASEVMPGMWNMLTFVFWNKEVKIYVNGVLALQRKSGVGKFLAETAHPLLIGSSRVAGKKLNKADSDMLINDIRLYMGSLTQDQIGKLYRQRKAHYSKYPIRNSWEKLPKYHGYMERTIPGYDPDFKKRLPGTASYLKNLRKVAYDRKKKTFSKVVKDRDVMKINVNGKFYAPIMFANHINMSMTREFGRRYEDFAAAGFKFIGAGPGSWRDMPHIWKGDGKYDFSLLDKLFRKLCELNPDGKIQVSLHPEPNHWFQRAHKDELELYYATGKSNDELRIYYSGNPGSDIWVNCVSRMLEAMVRHIEAQDYASYVYDYKIFMCGGGEWYWPGCFTGGVSGYSKSTQRSFRRYLAQKYKTDASLQKAWNDKKVTLKTALVPSPEFRFKSENYNFRDPVKARKCYDFRDYMNDRTVWSVKEITSALKRGCGNRKTVTIYYGYPIHYSGSHNPTQFTTGVYTLGRIFRLPTVDHIATPITYGRRQIGEAGVVINPFNGSALLHNKLLWHENDLRTHLYPQEYAGRPSNWQESCMQIRRGVTLASAMGMGCWFLGMPDYAYHESHLMDEMALQQKTMTKVMKEDTSSVAEVALIYDEDSMRHTGFNRSRFMADHIREFYNELFHTGSPFDSYLLSDIDNPAMKDYKLYLFVNTFEFTAEKMKKIHAKLSRNKAVAFWGYAPGLISGNGFSVKTMEKLTSIKFGYEKGPAKLSLRLKKTPHILTRRAGKHKTYPVGPVVYVKDPRAQILGTAGNKGALAVKKAPFGTSVYSLMPLNRDMIASLYEFSGVHSYLKTQDVFFANKSYLMLHTSKPGSKTFYLKTPSDVTEVYTGKNLGRAVTTFTDRDLPFGVSRFYHIKPVKRSAK